VASRFARFLVSPKVRLAAEEREQTIRGLSGDFDSQAERMSLEEMQA